MDPTTRKELKRAVTKRDKARAAEREAWAEMTKLMKRAYEPEDGTPGATFNEIGLIVGVTKARVYQILTGNRGGKKKAAPQVEAEEQPVEAEAAAV